MNLQKLAERREIRAVKLAQGVDLQTAALDLQGVGQYLQSLSASPEAAQMAPQMLQKLQRAYQAAAQHLQQLQRPAQPQQPQQIQV